MKQFLHGTSPLGFHASGSLGAVKPMIGNVGPFTTAVQESLPEGVSLTSIPGSTFEASLSLLHTILPSAQKEAVRTGTSETECRAKIMRDLSWDKVDFTNRFALKAFAKAGQKATFDGLCNIADPDLFLSVVVYSLGYEREVRLRLGFRNVNNMPSMWLAKYKKSPESFPTLHGNYKAG